MQSVTNPRWWEFYLVRYFVGTIVGTVIVIAIASNETNVLNPFFSRMINLEGKEFNASYLWLFGLIGLAFCYLASSPILVLHTFRSSVFSRQLREPGHTNNFRGLINYWILLGIIGGIIYIIFDMNITIFSKFEFWLLFFIFSVQAYLISFQIKNKNIFLMYKNLSTSRAVSTDSNKQYIESYKHLREHGNAFMILIMELMLGFILFNVESVKIVSLILLFWILPAGIVWFIGTYLESRIQDV